MPVRMFLVTGSNLCHSRLMVERDLGKRFEAGWETTMNEATNFEIGAFSYVLARSFPVILFMQGRKREFIQ